MTVEFLLEILGCFHVYLVAAIELNIEETLREKKRKFEGFYVQSVGSQNILSESFVVLQVKALLQNLSSR